MTTITVEATLELVTSLGCTVLEQKSFWKVTGPVGRKALYIGKAKRAMTRMDISGFEPEEHPAIKSLTPQDAKDLKLGAVRGMILPKELRDDIDLMEGITAAVRGLLGEAEGFKIGKAKSTEEEASSQAA